MSTSVNEQTAADLRKLADFIENNEGKVFMRDFAQHVTNSDIKIVKVSIVFQDATDA